MTHINQRRATAAQWTSANPVLELGEVGWETDTRKSKLGDGSTAWNSLSYTVSEVDITKADVGLGNVDNTSDLNKPISTATQAAINLKANKDSAELTGSPTAPTPAVGDNSTRIATSAYVYQNTAIQRTPSGQSTACWTKVLTLNGLTSTNGDSASVLIANQGSPGSTHKGNALIQVGQRGDNGATGDVFYFAGSSVSGTYIYQLVQQSTYVFELWVRRPSYDSPRFTFLRAPANGSIDLVTQQSAAPTSATGTIVVLTPKTMGSTDDISSAVAAATADSGRIIVGSGGSAPPYATGMSDANAAAGYQTWFQKVGKMVTVAVCVNKQATSVPIFTLPVGYRPAGAIFAALASASGTYVAGSGFSVQTNGSVSFYTSSLPNGGYYGSVTFPAEA